MNALVHLDSILKGDEPDLQELAESAHPGLLHASTIPRRIVAGDLVFDVLCQDVSKNGKKLLVSGVSYKLLLFLALHVNAKETVKKEAIKNWVYGSRTLASNVIASYMNRIRMELKNCESGMKISTVHGVGYRVFYNNAPH
ncbi:MAG TPA: winged helix-turn-helix domain-containing protein [Candidatus Paceibacterota bacterium]|nr:winged helix-turn-helix domain-containing protein [Candidatus Paceibacterota bacterium]